MSSTNDLDRFVLPDNLTQDWLFNVGDAIGVGDACYDNGSDVCRPADKQAAAASVDAGQKTFAAAFVGVSQEQILSSETNATKRITLRTEGVMEFKCPSQTFSKGAMVGIYVDSGTLLADPQQVDALYTANDTTNAIGTVVKYYGSATTRVRVYVRARKATGLGMLTVMPLERAATAIAATGGNIATANTVAVGLNLVSGADGSKGVKLPTMAPGETAIIINSVNNNTLKVYPPVGGTINALSANSNYNLGNSLLAEFICWNSTTYYTLPLVAS